MVTKSRFDCSHNTSYCLIEVVTKAGLTSHNTSYCLIEVVTKAGLTSHNISYCLIEVVTKAGFTVQITQVAALQRWSLNQV